MTVSLPTSLLPPLLLLVAATVLLLAPAPTRASLLPGLAANDFARGEALNVFANKMVSARNRLPYDYFTLPFCRPQRAHIEAAGRAKDSGRLGIGQILQGERARLTPYRLHVLEERACDAVCTSNFSVPDLNLLAARTVKGYRVRLSMDELPVVVREGKGSYQLGYPVGEVGEDASELLHVTNHLAFTVMYHVPDGYETMSVAGAYGGGQEEPSFRIVGFEVTPMSLADNQCPPGGGSLPMAEHGRGAPLSFPADAKARKPMEITFTYSVHFVKSDVRWSTRYDTLLKVSTGRKKMQVFAIINSMMLALFLTASLGVVLFRTLRRDCARYGIAASDLMEDLNDDFDNDVGWRMLRGDVFRAPAAAGMLSILCGSGAQLVLVTFVTLLFVLMGFVSPHRRGNLVSGLLVMWVLSSGFGGYVAARLHKAMGGGRWKWVTFGVALVLPGIAFLTFFVVNLFVWMMGSTGAAPFLTMFLLLFLWLGVSVPLAFLGTYMGYRRKAYDFPVRTNQIPRPIPRQPQYLASPTVHMIAGILPFGVVCIELRVILNSIYLDEFYHFFGFLVAVISILAITCAEVSVVVVFIKLSNSDYGWWWNSWLASASSGAYVLLYSVYYLLTSPGADPKNVVSNFLFLAYSTLGSLCFSLLTGAIGFLSSLAFVRRIYSDSIDD